MSTNTSYKLTLTTDTDCMFYLDGKQQLQLLKGLAYELPMHPGKYVLRFVSMEKSDVGYGEDFEMPAMNIKYEVIFKSIEKKESVNQGKKVEQKEKTDNNLLQGIRKRQETRRVQMKEEQRKMAEVMRKLGEVAQQQK